MFVKTHTILHWSLIVNSKQKIIELVNRPGLGPVGKGAHHQDIYNDTQQSMCQFQVQIPLRLLMHCFGRPSRALTRSPSEKPFKAVDNVKHFNRFDVTIEIADLWLWGHQFLFWWTHFLLDHALRSRTPGPRTELRPHSGTSTRVHAWKNHAQSP